MQDKNVLDVSDSDMFMILVAAIIFTRTDDGTKGCILRAFERAQAFSTEVIQRYGPSSI